MANFLLEVYPDVTQWKEILQKIEQLSEQQQWTTEQQFDVTLICEEWFMNIVNHGQCDPNKVIIVKVEELPSGVISMYFSDPGIPFSPFQKQKQKNITASVEQKVGGLGVHFIQNKISDYHYQYLDMRNQLEMFYNNNQNNGGV